MDEIQEMIGKTPVSITGSKDDDEIVFIFSDGSACRFYHVQDCCEIVIVEDVNGDWADLIGNPILEASERTSKEHDGTENSCWDESNTWTFYTFRGIGGTVDVRWHGASNGYYSESVYLHFTPAPCGGTTEGE